MDKSNTICVHGVNIDAICTFDASWVDNGIGSYEYWGSRETHSSWGWEIDSATMSPQESIKDACAQYLHEVGFPIHRRKSYLKALRRKVRHVAAVFNSEDSYQDYFSDEELEEAAGDAPESEPDFDYPEEPMHYDWEDEHS